MDFIKLGTILKDARTRLGYTQPDIAAMFGMTPSNVSSWERGNSKIDIESYLRLCNFYGLEAEQPLAKATEGIPAYSEIFTTVDDMTNVERTLISKFRMLNNLGVEKLINYMDDLVDSNRYVIDELSASAWRKTRGDGSVIPLETRSKTRRVVVAAKSKENTPPGYEDMPIEILDRLHKARDAAQDGNI